MKPRTPFVRKHIHRWILTDYERVDSWTVRLLRKCDDCREKAVAWLPAGDVLLRDTPWELLALIDTQWQLLSTQIVPTPPRGTPPVPVSPRV